MGDVIKFRGPQPPANTEVEAEIMLEVKAYRDGRITVWVSHDITENAQFWWLFSCLALASEGILEFQRERR